MSPHVACYRLAKDLAEYSPADQELKERHSWLLSRLKLAGDATGHERPSIESALKDLAQFYDEMRQQEWPEELRLGIYETLADTTRGFPFWRPLFGLPSKPGLMENIIQGNSDNAPDCILEVARRVLWKRRDKSATAQLRPVLRLIANCCADNNVNRSIIVRRGGLELLMLMVRYQVNCDLVIPTLYNVCVDYDEPAASKGEPWPPLQQMQTGSEGDYDSGLAVNAAEQDLAKWWDHHDGIGSVQALLKVKSYAENCPGTLADLIEMASRAALYGIDRLVPSTLHMGSTESLEVSSIALIDDLLTKGSELANVDVDCRVSICQSVLNIFSQTECRSAVVSIDGAIWKLIHLPYGLNEDDDHEPLLPYRKEFLKLIYNISAQEAYGNRFNAQSKLIQDCIQSLGGHKQQSDLENAAKPLDEARSRLVGPWASMCVLVANTLISPDRAKRLVCETSIAAVITGLIRSLSKSDDILLPAVDVALRLALSREGQDALHAVKTISAVSLILNPRSEVNSIGMDIQREAVTLVRLVIKGRAEYLSELTFESQRSEGTRQPSDIMAVIFSLFEKTNDTRTKTEIGRLFIEILRTLFSSAQPHSLTVSNASQTNPSHVSLAMESTFLSIFGSVASSSLTASSPSPPYTIADMISYILTQPQPPVQLSSIPAPPSSPQIQAEAEAWFGLALLASLPITHPWLFSALGRNDLQLLNRLREIASQGSDIDTFREEDSRIEQHVSHELGEAVRNIDLNASSPSTPERRTEGTGAEKGARQTKKLPDPRYQNVKFLVVKLVQSQAQAQAQWRTRAQGPSTTFASAPTPATTAPTDRATATTSLVRSGLEAAAAEMGLDWTFV